MTQAWFDSAKVPALYNKGQMPLNVWRGGTITEVSEEHQQTKMDETGKGGKGEPLFWDSPANTQPRMQVYVTVQTTERNPADPDDTGLRRIFIPKNGHAPGSVFTETGNALKEAGSRNGLEVGGELYQMFTGTTPSKVQGFQDRKLWKMAYRPPANQFFATEVPAAPAPQASSNGQPAQHPSVPTPSGMFQQPAPQQPEEYRQPTHAQGYGPPAPQPIAAQQQPVAAAAQQPWAQPAAQVQQAPQQLPSYAGAPAASNHPQWGPSGGPQEQYAPAAQQAPQWPTAPPQSQSPTAAPPAQQPAAQGQQAYQPPPVDPRNPFG